MAKVSKKRTLLQQRVMELIKTHGGIRAAGRATGVNPTYLWKLRDGLKTSPSDNILEKLGLKRVETIETVRG